MASAGNFLASRVAPLHQHRCKGAFACDAKHTLLFRLTIVLGVCAAVFPMAMSAAHAQKQTPKHAKLTAPVVEEIGAASAAYHCATFSETRC